MNAFHPQSLKCYLLATLLFSPASAYGQVFSHWINGAGGAYETPSSWIGSQAPLPENQTRFAIPGSYSVEFNTDQEIVHVNVANNSHPTFSIGGNQSTDRTYDLSGGLRIEDEGQLTIESGTGAGRFHLDVFQNVVVDGLPNNPNAGVLTLRDGARITSAALITGLAADTQGNVLITGHDTEWNSAFMTAGADGDGEVTVEAGASLNVDFFTTLAFERGTTSRVNIDGVGTDGLPSTWSVTNKVEIGDGGSAELNVTGGARAIHSEVVLANFRQSSGTANISGVDAAGNPSSWTTGNFVASFLGGESELNIDGGGQVFSDNVILAGDGSSAATISGSSPNGTPSAWTISGELDMGLGTSRTGEIFVRDGGHLSTTTTNMATAAIGAIGRIELSSSVENVNSTWSNSGDVYVGGNSDGPGSFGRLELRDSSRVDVGGTIKIYDRGDVRVRDDSLLIADRIDNSEAGNFEQTGGEVQFNRFDGNLVHSEGTIAPGIGGSAALLIGDFTQQNSGTLELEVGGLIGSHDAFSITGTADLDGLLELSLINGFTPGSGDTFEVMTASSLLGFFDNAFNGQRVDTSDGLGSFIVNYGIGSAFDPDSIVLSDFEAGMLLGDFDLDGDVDADDIDFYSGNIGQNAAGNLAKLDLDNDGMVTLADHDQHVTTLVQTSNGEVGALIGDINLDGNVNVLGDAFALVGNLGTATSGWSQGDLNADGNVNVLGDAFRLVGNLGQSNGSSSALKTAAVPEPNGALILAVAGLAAAARRRFSY